MIKMLLRSWLIFFGLNSPPYNAIVAAAEKSRFLAAELNAFAELKGWEFARAEEGRGVYADPKNKVIAFDPSWSEPANIFATTLAHELGHVLLPGGMGGSPALNPDQAVANGLSNEGVALLSEYIVAIQLGLTGGSAGHMHSDSSDSRLTLQLNELALSAGIDVKSVTWGGASRSRSACRRERPAWDGYCCAVSISRWPRARRW
ncbi:hypothetical protein [Burkholderia ambifaria]|uniref:hypothetical protein n=1 Tax=Burkholderia ambifaria TaxID=152480 RepID=UPI00158E12DF|nr:hypothetical protein [Burkholderia ambifaria]